MIAGRTPDDAMSAFLILCRTREIVPRHYEARVIVVPAGEVGSDMPARSESRIFESAELAATECIRMAEAMRKRLCFWGHDVVNADASAASTWALNAPASSAGTESH